MKASYAGDASFDPSFATQKFTIIKGSTQAALSASSTSYTGKPIVFTVSLSTLSLNAAPTGTVALKIGSTILREGKLTGTAGSGGSLATGTATITVSTLPAGKSEIVAVYSGDDNYAGSTSNSVTVTGQPFFTIASTTGKLFAEHSTGSVNIVTTSEDGYAGTVDYTCVLTSSIPTTATPAECGMYPATATLTAGGVAKPQMLIFGKGTKLPTGVTLGSNSNARWIGAGSAVLACGLLFGVPARRRRWRSMLSLLLILVAVGGFSACVTPAKIISVGIYTFKVTGTDSKDKTKTATATVTVEVV
jgi:Big-like domain-containing protein